jgi:serine/threonine protein kinase
MSVDDVALGRFLLERGLLLPDEHESSEKERKATGRPLAQILVERAFLSPVQVQDALATLEKRVRFCPRCNVPVYVTRVRADGESCPRCLGPVKWHEESVVAQIRDLESIVQLTRDELPPDVEAARTRPEKIFGKYVLLEEVGRGGAGVVHKAWDTMLAEYVALKFIRDQKLGHETGREAKKAREEQILDLLQEARAALRLRHEHIIAVRDIGRIDQQFYIAMDYVEGRTLADHIRHAQQRGQLSPLYDDPVFYLGVLRDVTNALHYAHTFPKPIVHCDFKPGNVLISKTGTAFVMDFGLARALGAQKEPEGEEKVRGTPAYMAPEQLSGRNDEIGPRTDVYAVGATLYELLAGRPVYTGDPVAILLQAIRLTPERPMEVLRKATEGRQQETTKIMLRMSKLEEICLHCLEKEPRARSANAREVAQELATVIEAMEAGRENGMVPQKVLEAQERSEIHRVDEHITRLDLERALAETETIERKRDTTRIRERLEDRRRQVQLLDQLRAHLMERLNAQRPTFSELVLANETLENVEIMKATPKRIYVLENDRPHDVPWSLIPAEQVVSMCDAMKVEQPEDRLALGILCHHALLPTLALKYLTSLSGTPLDEEAKRVLQSTA